jgi:thioesterase domain-containing protein
MNCRFTILREGDKSAPVFLFPGAGGDARELKGLASALRCSRAILGVEFNAFLPATTTPDTVESLAEACFDEIRKMQRHGPYSLVGYSFGGLVAIEVARKLKNTGEEVRLLGIIDTIFDHRHWPKGLFLKAQARRVCCHLRTIWAMPLRTGAQEFAERLRRLYLRLRERFAPPEATMTATSTDTASTQERCMSAAGRYVPSHHGGKIVVFKAEDDEDFACDVARLWQPFADTIATETIGGSHLDIVRNSHSISQLAAALDDRLDNLTSAATCADPETAQPKVLILTALPWLPAMRLALELSEAGFTVDAVCPRGCAVEKMSFVKRGYKYRPITSIKRLRRIILMSRPMLLVPCDDYVTRQLHELFKAEEPNGPDSFWLRALITRSLGQPQHFSTLYSRYGIGSLAREMNIQGPQTEAVDDANTLKTDVKSLGLPMVLKADGTWGGRGVVIAASYPEAMRAFHKLSAPPSVFRALKRLLINRDCTLLLPCLRRSRPAICAQRFVPGRPANAAVACWEGRVLAAVFVEVLFSNGATGPSTVVRVISHPEMALTVERLVDRLKLSGLCGFDFVLSAEDGTAQFVELNPRATPTCHLISADGKDLLGALRNALLGSAPVSGGTPYTDPIVLFRKKGFLRPVTPCLESAVHDIPWKSTELVRLSQALPYRWGHSIDAPYPSHCRQSREPEWS